MAECNKVDKVIDFGIFDRLGDRNGLSFRGYNFNLKDLDKDITPDVAEFIKNELHYIIKADPKTKGSYHLLACQKSKKSGKLECEEKRQISSKAAMAVFSFLASLELLCELAKADPSL